MSDPTQDIPLDPQGEEPRRCERCGECLPVYPGRGRRRVFCSQKCKRSKERKSSGLALNVKALLRVVEEERRLANRIKHLERRRATLRAMVAEAVR